MGTSPDRAAILSDVAVLQAFGAAQESDVRRGIPPRLENLVRWAMQQIEAHPEESEALAVLEYVASRFPRAWISIADLRRRLKQPEEELIATRRFVDAEPREAEGWRRLVALYKQSGAAAAEMEATLQLIALANTPYREISGAAARFSQLTHDGRLTDIAARSITAERLRGLMEGRLSEADATDLSRLGWICVQMKDHERAVELGRRGLSMDPNNDYCRKLADLRW